MNANQEKATTPMNIGLKVGLLVGVVNMLLYTIIFIFKQETSIYSTFLKYLTIAVAIFYSHRLYKSYNNSFLDYSQGVGIGTLVSLVSGIILSIYIDLYQKYIDPDVLLRMAEEIKNSLRRAGSTDEYQIEQMAQSSLKFSSGYPSILIGIMCILFLGFIFSLIISAITKNKTKIQTTVYD